ncbi:nucleotide exchange factor GrpE [Streptomyces sp. AC627_RSS907]|uniref:nucleotide exchange factor GrpE n=1 Tax=Streptomyces sp. AC627_RSS907 TaxID=2823684 RepID=UPI001C247CCF|nr:nucleotide exchange factor GrpE [Streptomyces sp. AC627_RSS907]
MNRDPSTPRKPGRKPGGRPPVVIQDRRRIDPVAFRPRRPAPAEPAGTPSKGPAPATEAAALRRARSEAAGLRSENAELIADLQRLKAEYDNYRKRVRRDRLAIREIAVANVLSGLLPVLDALEAARGPDIDDTASGAVADLLRARLTALGLQPVGVPGESFDPAVHEAVTYRSSDRAPRAVCTEVLRRGYRVGGQLLRPAQVSVTGPPHTRAWG